MPVPTVMPAERADWIAEHALSSTYLKSCGGVKLVRLCACQYGQCGHCGHGDHAKCSTRRHPEQIRPRPHTYVVGRSGGARTEVWTTGESCRWVCPCTAPAHSAPPADEAPKAPVRRAPGGLRPGDTVWLTPKTLGCPGVCWTKPRCTVVTTGYPYVEVKVGRKVHRVHVDNIRRSDPASACGVVPTKRKARPALPDGFQEIPLF